MNRFEEKIQEAQTPLERDNPQVLQVNLGKLCNLTCVHCHVEAGPAKTRENMEAHTAESVVVLMDHFPFETLDLTGGAPEMNPHFRYLVREAKKRHMHVIDRCNLTVFFEKHFEDIPEFLAGHDVEIVASLPCYSADNVDKQRGGGTFEQSIQALKRLNDLDYGKPGAKRILNLVYNPVGAHLPPPQFRLEQEYKERLLRDFGIEFHHLYCITNMPITRYALYLKANKEYEAYVSLLEKNFNPGTLEGLMCRNTLNVGWDGRLYDCDFNQALDLPMRNGKPLTVFDVTDEALRHSKIQTGEHCFGCTAGAGSSCGGVLQ